MSLLFYDQVLVLPAPIGSVGVSVFDRCIVRGSGARAVRVDPCIPRVARQCFFWFGYTGSREVLVTGDAVINGSPIDLFPYLSNS